MAKEFRTIQESFNIMVDELKKNIEGLSKVENERQMTISSISHDICSHHQQLHLGK